MEEIWKDIRGYEGLYQVSNLGRIKSLNYNNTKQEKILKGSQDKSGYRLAGLCKDGKVSAKRIHRLVAEAFIPKLENKTEVNHIDGNKKNNCINNLEWCDRKENMKHAAKNGLSGFKNGKDNINAKEILQYDLKENFIKMWHCIADIEKELGIRNRI